LNHEAFDFSIFGNSTFNLYAGIEFRDSIFC